MNFDIKTGLVIELEKNIRGRRFAENEPKTPKGIARLLGISYQAVQKKLQKNYFTVTEALLIQKPCSPNSPSTTSLRSKPYEPTRF